MKKFSHKLCVGGGNNAVNKNGKEHNVRVFTVAAERNTHIILASCAQQPSSPYGYGGRMRQ